MGGRRLASCPPCTEHSQRFQGRAAKATRTTSARQGPMLLPAWPLGLLAQTGRKNQATAPLNVHSGHKAMPSLSSIWWRKLNYHWTCPTGNQVMQCSWSQAGKWQELVLHTGRHQVSRKHRCLLKELLQPQAAVLSHRLSPEKLLEGRGTGQSSGKPTQI